MANEAIGAVYEFWDKEKEALADLRGRARHFTDSIWDYYHVNIYGTVTRKIMEMAEKVVEDEGTSFVIAYSECAESADDRSFEEYEVVDGQIRVIGADETVIPAGSEATTCDGCADPEAPPTCCDVDNCDDGCCRETGLLPPDDAHQCLPGTQPDACGHGSTLCEDCGGGSCEENQECADSGAGGGSGGECLDVEGFYEVTNSMGAIQQERFEQSGCTVRWSEFSGAGGVPPRGQHPERNGKLQPRGPWRLSMLHVRIRRLAWFAHLSGHLRRALPYLQRR